MEEKKVKVGTAPKWMHNGKSPRPVPQPASERSSPNEKPKKNK